MFYEKNQYPLIVFTDLDGSLLNHDDYSYSDAKPALKLIEQHRIPLIPVSSKTCCEIQFIFQNMTMHHPIIAENGAAIVVPPDYFANPEEEVILNAADVSYDDIVKILSELRHEFAFIGFSNMSDNKVASITGLSRAEAIRAKERHSSEPILWEDSTEQFAAFRQALIENGLTLTRGGRFWHVMGKNNKGQAVSDMLEVYRTNGIEFEQSVGLGDSENDIPLLNVVDVPVVIKKSDNTHLRAVVKKTPIFSQGIGPIGWNEVMLKLISQGV